MQDQYMQANMLGNAAEMAYVYPPSAPLPPQAMPVPHGQLNQPHQQQQQQQQQHGHSWVGNDGNTLLVVATLITTLSYQLGTNIPGGYWQDTNAKAPDGPHRAGDPIMRDLHRPRYWVFMAASWVSFASSMLMTLSLLVQMPVTSRHVRWSFAVAYSSLVLSFIVSQPKTHLSLDILLAVAVMAFLWLMISVRPEHRARIINLLCCGHQN